LTVPDIRIPVPAGRAGPDPEVVARARELRLHRILVPLNGTPAAEHALPFAGLVARWLGSELTLFHSLQPMHPVRVGRPGHVPYPDAQHDRGAHLATSYLEEVAARLRPHGVSARWSVATGLIAQMISTRAVAGGFGLTVISGQPSPRVVRKIQPSVIDELWRLSATPLMLINHARVALGDAIVQEPRVIFVPFDGSRTSNAALPLASVLAQAAGARLALVVESQAPKRVNGSSEEKPPDGPGAALAEQVAAGLRAAGCEAGVEAVSGGEIAIARRQIQERGSWVVAGSSMRSGLARLVLGSRADNFLRHCRGPLVVVPDPKVAEKRGRRAHRESLLTPEAGS
jgi:nucleotide-binding universal stress UspA family protein